MPVRAARYLLDGPVMAVGNPDGLRSITQHQATKGRVVFYVLNVLESRTVTRRSGPSAWLQQIGLLTAIPFVLLVGPMLGYGVGTAIDRRWLHAPWGLVTGMCLGLIASARVTVQLIRQARDLGSRGDG